MGIKGEFSVNAEITDGAFKVVVEEGRVKSMHFLDICLGEYPDLVYSAEDCEETAELFMKLARVITMKVDIPDEDSE